METNISAIKKDLRTVEVEFQHKGVTHKRDVNACFDDKGKYDKDATEARVAEVATGVTHKIDLGVITNPPPEPEEKATAIEAE